MDDIAKDVLALFDFFHELFVRSSITDIRLVRRHSLRAGIGVPPILNLPVEIHTAISSRSRENLVCLKMLLTALLSGQTLGRAEC